MSSPCRPFPSRNATFSCLGASRIDTSSSQRLARCTSPVFEEGALLEFEGSSVVEGSSVAGDSGAAADWT